MRAVHAALRARHEPVCLLDQHAIATTTIELFVGLTVHGVLGLGDDLIALEAITAVYARPYDVRKLPALTEVGPLAPLWRHGLALDDAMQAWVEVTPALVVNRPAAMASNGSKPYQAALIRSAGLDVPDTLVTTDPSAALAFRDRHGSVIYKSVSGVRSVVSRLGPKQQGRLADIENCPTQFQQYIRGTDYRVHVVGDKVFAAEIVSTADDYRYAGRTGHSIEIRACAPEHELAERCRRLAAELSLPVAGIDLRRTPEGRWYCFEVNPSPGFTFYQDATGQKIAEAVASLLAGGRSA
jgi:glutathione synthase/RimK-type ligase-like ATP-grasp enzyme